MKVRTKYRRSEILETAPYELDRERIIETVEKGFDPELPTDEELVKWGSAIISGPSEFDPDNLHHGLLLAREFDVSLSLKTTLNGKLTLRAYRQPLLGNTMPRVDEVYEGLIPRSCANALALFLWHLDHE